MFLATTGMLHDRNESRAEARTPSKAYLSQSLLKIYVLDHVVDYWRTVGKTSDNTTTIEWQFQCDNLAWPRCEREIELFNDLRMYSRRNYSPNFQGQLRPFGNSASCLEARLSTLPNLRSLNAQAFISVPESTFKSFSRLMYLRIPVRASNITDSAFQHLSNLLRLDMSCIPTLV
eukprot:gb/GECG01014993.1/.p1 GENE.gb/GECG01014993.1/~~gb/GECG01014993.1/.p1  ORF type:complete len:175 (+),score=3.63 gb/GECG01014993.1/:1-525(+)